MDPVRPPTGAMTVDDPQAGWLKRTYRRLVHDVPFRFVFHLPGVARALSSLPPDAVVLDLGANRIEQDQLTGRRVIGLATTPSPLAAVAADPQTLPIRSGSLDAVFSRDLFGRLPAPWIASREVVRILKPGGIACVVVPLHMPARGDDDYYRFTVRGLRALFEGLETIGEGVATGPGAFQAVYFVEYGLLYLPTMVQRLARLLLTWGLFTYRLVDRLPADPERIARIAQTVYFVGRKRADALPDAKA
ncbi:MAG: methyltransferase domain-containing protein [Candidatus Riflebacteria bacterium]|nr:methyltransferase domain-containing protein [Candidatus Riflebacteria bacterium]